MFRMLNDSDVERLADGVCAVLEQLGLHCQNAEVLRALEKAGARVDHAAEVARFPQKLIRAFVDALRKEDKSGWGRFMRGGNEQVIYSGYQPATPPAQFQAPPSVYLFHELSTYFYDDDRQERRLGNRQDFIKLIKLGDQLNPQRGSGHSLNLSGDTPAGIEPLVAARVLIEHSRHPTGVYVMDVRQIPYLEEIAGIAGIENPYFHWMANVLCNSPLKMDNKVAERLLYMVKAGCDPIKVCGMPVAGINMPITTAGSTVILAAEFIALWFAARALGSTAPLVGMPVSGTMDLSSGDVSFVALDAARTRLTVCDFMRKWAGIQLSPGPGEWSPTKTPGLYCTLEKAYFSMIAAAFTGVHPDIGVGHVDAGLAISPVQVLLDYEFTEGLKLLEPPPITAETIGLDAILEIGFGFREDYLAHSHTVQHMRAASWTPRYFSRNGWTPKLEEQLLEKARAHVNELIAAHQAPPGKADQLARIDQVIQRARRELCQ
jgi:trimethylamine--corrinoid protein Co-methyltransferase